MSPIRGGGRLYKHFAIGVKNAMFIASSIFSSAIFSHSHFLINMEAIL